MKDIQKRFALFLGACIPARLALTALAYKLQVNYLPFMGVITLFIAFGFLYLYFTGARQKGSETFGQPIWWRNLRFVHGLLYLLFSLLAINKYKNAYLVILCDTFLGFIFFIWHHYWTGRFTQIYN